MPTKPARYLRVLPLVAVAGIGAYGLLSSNALLGVLLFVAIVFFAGALVVWARGADAAARSVMTRTATGALLCAPALLVLFFSFESGGFFPDSVALGDIAVAIVLVIRMSLARRPLAAFTPRALVPLFGLAGLAGWALLSGTWSHAPGRATIAFDRDLLYALIFALFASVGATRERLVWAVRAVAFAMAAVTAVALLSRVAPDVLSTAFNPEADGRLAYPLTYWNALGVFCAVAAVLCLHLAANDERRIIRVLSAAALPVIGAALLLTYSRGGLIAAVIGVILYATLGRPRGLLSALIATAPPTAIAMKAAYSATLLSANGPPSPAAIHQGHHLAAIVLGCVAGVLLLRALLLRLDRALEGEGSPIDRHRRSLRKACVVAAVMAVAVAVVLGAPSAVEQRWNQFVDQQAPAAGPLLRNRLSSVSSDGRIQLWDIALDAFRAHPLDGTGADTYEIVYYEHRQGLSVVVNAHSLYIETLGDLGLVGLAFVLLFVLGTLGGLLPLRRGRERALYAALFSAGLAWSLHAGVDWDWQMPATSLWLAALGGLALGRRGWSRRTPGATAGNVRSFVVGAVVVGAAVFPSLVLASQIRLNDASAAYASGDCERADRLARSSIDVLGTRAPAWQIQALCAVRERRYRQARADLRSGLAEDPNDWQLQAALAATTAAEGADARSDAASALRLNPIDPSVRLLAEALAAGPSAGARRAALTFLSGQSLIESG
ncbi:MAG TPA: O-antigen ligase family protein [Solirubrobacteraceae bacterium]